MSEITTADRLSELYKTLFQFQQHLDQSLPNSKAAFDAAKIVLDFIADILESKNRAKISQIDFDNVQKSAYLIE